MADESLIQKEQRITTSYRAFLKKVREAFNNHCDEIKAKTTEKFNAIPESNEAGRRKVLDDQKEELDKTLAELKQLLAKKGAEMRRELESIAKEKEAKSFNLEEQLEEVATK